MLRGPTHRIGVEMRITFSRRRLSMAQELADNGEPQATPGANRGERMAQVVDANALKARGPFRTVRQS